MAPLDPRGDLELLPIVVPLFHSGGDSFKEIRVIFLRSQFYLDTVCVNLCFQTLNSFSCLCLCAFDPTYKSLHYIHHQNHKLLACFSKVINNCRDHRCLVTSVKRADEFVAKMCSHPNAQSKSWVWPLCLWSFPGVWLHLYQVTIWGQESPQQSKCPPAS